MNRQDIEYVAIGAAAAIAGVALYFRRHEVFPTLLSEVFFGVMPNSPLMQKGEDSCVWCGKEFPEPDDWFDADHDVKYQQAMKPWVMLSFGTKRASVMACEVLHMELWWMTGGKK